jgi:DNA mismatch endonuclease (patch repair protein)
MYERLVAAFEMDDADMGTSVTPNASLTGSISGVPRQIDVLVDTRFERDNSRRLIFDAKRRSRLLPRRKRAPLSRGEAMSRIRSTGTAPERVVRLLLAHSGIRYRMNVRDLPGKPDFANKRRKFAIFVHGCFWHSHDNCGLASDPKSNRSYWQPKLERTKARDRAHLERLKELGYRVLVIWECSSRKPDLAAEQIVDFFKDADWR